MKRGSGLQRRTPLQNRAPMRRGGGAEIPPSRLDHEPPRIDFEAARARMAGRSTRAPEYAGPVETSKATPRPSSTGFPPVVKQTLLDRDHMACVRCGRPVEVIGWNPQHRDNRAMGGTRDPRINRPSNGIVLCGSGTTGCHGWVEEHEEESARNGWVVRSWADATSVPVLYAAFPDATGGAAWGLLTDQGTVWRTAAPLDGDAHSVARRKEALR